MVQVDVQLELATHRFFTRQCLVRDTERALIDPNLLHSHKSKIKNKFTSPTISKLQENEILHCSSSRPSALRFHPHLARRRNDTL